MGHASKRQFVRSGGALLTASGRVLALVPRLLRRRRRRDETIIAWEEEELLLDGDAYFARLTDAIDHAREHISLEVYILQADAVGLAVEAALARAAARGVAVRLLVDGVGSASWTRARARHLASQGVEVRVYHPPPWLILPMLWARGPGRLSRAFRFVNRRNHRKVTLVDADEAFVGSYNLEGRHAHAVVGAQAWRDAAVRVRGLGVAILQRAFDRAWRHSWRVTAQGVRPTFAVHLHPITVPAGHLVRLNHGLRLRARWRRELLSRIGSAHRRVWIASAYFVPDRQLLYALALAAAAGADVRILVPHRSDHWFMPVLTSAFYQCLIQSGVHVHEYLPSMLHEKVMVVDDWVSVGSTNLNYRSFLHDLEADVVLTNPATRAELERAFQDDLGRSRAIDPQEWLARSWLQRFCSRLALILKHWM